MPTERETALTALASLVGTALGVTVTRDSDIPLDHLVRGTVRAVVTDGAVNEVIPIMSPLRYSVVRRADVILAYTAATEALRDTGIDDALADIATAINADRTLGGAVEWAEPQAPEASPAELDGAGRVVVMGVNLTFTSTSLAAA